MSVNSLIALIENDRMPEWERAIKALEAAFAWCKQVATAQHITKIAGEFSRIEALRCIIALHKALQEGIEYLDSLPNLLEAGQPGSTLWEDLKSKQARIRDIAGQLAQMEAELEHLIQVETDLKEKIEQQERLKHSLELRKAELERLSRLANPKAIRDLQEQVKELEERIKSVEAGELEIRIRDQSIKLIQLLESHLQALHPQVSELLREAENKEREMRETVLALESARARYERARLELEKLKAELEPYIEADMIIAQALPGADNILKLLEEARYLMNRAEEALKHAMERSEREARLSVVSITGEHLE